MSLADQVGVTNGKWTGGSCAVFLLLLIKGRDITWWRKILTINTLLAHECMCDFNSYVLEKIIYVLLGVCYNWIFFFFLKRKITKFSFLF